MAEPDGPLAGRVVLLTRPAERGAGLVHRLEELGARVAARPSIALEAPIDRETAREAVARLGAYDWLLFTSPSGVRFFFVEVERQQVSVPALTARIGAIGPATARALEERGLSPSLVAQTSHAEGFAAALGGRVVAGQRVLLVRPEVAREVLPEALAATGARVDAVPFYRNVPAAGVGELAREICDGAFDAVVFTSPSTLARLLEVAPRAGRPLRDALLDAGVVAIGEVTARALRQAGLRADATASEPSEDGIVEAVLSLFGR